VETYDAGLKKEYDGEAHRYKNLCEQLYQQIQELVKQNSIDLASPIEVRLKTWDSIARNLKDKKYEPQKLDEIHDLAGIRIVTLFKKDNDKTAEVIEKTFKIISKEDKQLKLSKNQFGYGSIHYIVEMPGEWSTMPSVKMLVGLRAEIQLRTIAQHAWAAVSRVLTYKEENQIPVPIQRSINRAAALLELVDLEFTRVLDERSKYLESINPLVGDFSLNNDVLKTIARNVFPVENMDGDEDFSEVLDEMTTFGVVSSLDLINRIKNKLVEVLKEDKKHKAVYGNASVEDERDAERLKRGVFFTHVGLYREFLRKEFGENYQQLISKKVNREFSRVKQNLKEP